MKVLQIIDSLHAGGAERMAVTYANLLQEKGIQSYLCCTREEGFLKVNLHQEVGYIFLKKKKSLDLKAFLKLKRFIGENQINILHAHGTSFFTAVLQKIINPKLKIVWHDHNGARAKGNREEYKAIFLSSYLFNVVIAVNVPLKNWAEKNLKVQFVEYLPNFVEQSLFKVNDLPSENDQNIICLANLRSPKNHNNLLEAFAIVIKEFPKAKLHIVGADYKNEYSSTLKEYIKKKELSEQIILYGARKEVQNFLENAAIGILSSDSEGLPMALLEYGQAGLAVVATDVGQCREVIADFGKIVPAKDPEALAQAMMHYLDSKEKRMKDGKRFQEHIRQNYTENAIFPQLLEIYQNL